MDADSMDTLRKLCYFDGATCLINNGYTEGETETDNNRDFIIVKKYYVLLDADGEQLDKVSYTIYTSRHYKAGAYDATQQFKAVWEQE